MLWLGLLSRDTGTPASQHLGIKDEVVALNFNLAVTLRLSRYDLEKTQNEQKNLAIRIANAVTQGMGFGSGESDTEDVIAGDPYADANTVIM